jgi:hypothetical protein
MRNSAYIRTQGGRIKSQPIKLCFWRYAMSYKKFESRRAAEKRRKRAQRTWLFLILGGVVLIGAALLVFRGRTPSQPLAAVSVNGSPSLRVDKDKVDLGDVQLGQTVQVSFQLTNVGSQPLRFAQAPYVEVVEGC